MLGPRTKIAVLVSGGGTNLQALIDAQKAGTIVDGQISLVVSSKAGAYALTRAEENGIDSMVMEDEASLIEALQAAGIQMVVLAGFLKILSPAFIQAFADRIINIHPSLIPSFCGDGCYGLHVHEKALNYGVKVTGATVHYVNEITDGGRIIAQKAVEIQDGDTPEILQRRVMEEAEWILLPQAAQDVARRIREEQQ